MDWLMLDNFVKLNRNALELMFIITLCLLVHCTVMYGLFFFYKTAPKKDIIKNIILTIIAIAWAIVVGYLLFR